MIIFAKKVQIIEKIERKLLYLICDGVFYDKELSLTKKRQRILDIISSVVLALPVAYLFFKHILLVCVQNWMEPFFGCAAFIMGVLYPFYNKKNKIVEIEKTVIRNKHAVYLLNNLRYRYHEVDGNFMEFLYIQYYSLGDLDEEIENRSEYFNKEMMKNPKFKEDMDKTIYGTIETYNLQHLLTQQ